MNSWEQIQQTIDYIEENISDQLTIEGLAKIAALSPFYYQRLFSRLVRKSVMEYIKLRRIARSTEVLLEENKRIIDVAFDVGFSSHETFTRAFKEAFNITPEEYRKNPIRLNNMGKPQLIFNYTLIDEDTPLVIDGIVLEITRKQILTPLNFIGLVKETPITEFGIETGIDNLATLWDDFHDNKHNIPNLTSHGDELGVAFTGVKEGCFRYFAGAEASSDEKNEGYENWKLMEGEYIVCSFEAEDFEHLIMDVIYKVQRYLFETWLPRHKLTTKPFSIERYASYNQETTKMEIWVSPIPIE